MLRVGQSKDAQCAPLAAAVGDEGAGPLLEPAWVVALLPRRLQLLVGVAQVGHVVGGAQPVHKQLDLAGRGLFVAGGTDDHAVAGQNLLVQPGHIVLEHTAALAALKPAVVAHAASGAGLDVQVPQVDHADGGPRLLRPLQGVLEPELAELALSSGVNAQNMHVFNPPDCTAGPRPSETGRRVPRPCGRS